MPLNDFYTFDPFHRSYTNLAGKTRGVTPGWRSKPGLVFNGGVLYLYGGLAVSGGLLAPSHSSRTRCLLGRRAFSLPSATFLMPTRAPPDVYDDLQEYNLTSSAWTDLTQTMHGPLPSGRQSMGLDIASDQLYMFGGQNQAGTFRIVRLCKPVGVRPHK